MYPLHQKRFAFVGGTPLGAQPLKPHMLTSLFMIYHRVVIMPTLQEVLDSALKYQFEYAIILTDSSGEVKVAIGLNGLTRKINDTILSYMNLLDKFGVQYTASVYDVRTKRQISILDIPMFFSVEDNQQNLGFRPGGYM